MKKIVSLILTFVAVSLVIAVVAMKYIVPPAHVQIEAAPQIAETGSATNVKNNETQPIEFNLIDDSGAVLPAKTLKAKLPL